MSDIDERKAAADVAHWTRGLNETIDRAHRFGLIVIVELETAMLQVAGSPAVISHISTRVLKPITPRNS